MRINLNNFVFLNEFLIIMNIVQIKASREERVDIDIIKPDQVLQAPAEANLRRQAAIPLEMVDNLVRFENDW